MDTYKVLNKQVYIKGDYSLVPIRAEDRFAIMKWRNEQIYHLRQNKLLTKVDQDAYFENVVSKLFDQDQPTQILFSFLEGEKCIGYGGLVHINWKDKNAEISFIIETELESDQFEFHWINYLRLIESVAFEELNFHKIFTYAYDLRPRLYIALEQRGFIKEALLKEHAYFEGNFINVIIHAKLNNQIVLREASLEDIETTFNWVNQNSIRKYAYNQNNVIKEDHIEWFNNKLKSDECTYLILEKCNHSIGSIRFDIDKDNLTAKISYLIDSNYTGKGFGTYILKNGLKNLVSLRPDIISVYGYVLRNNLASIKIFKNLNYQVTYESDSELKFEKRLL